MSYVSVLVSMATYKVAPIIVKAYVFGQTILSWLTDVLFLGGVDTMIVFRPTYILHLPDAFPSPLDLLHALLCFRDKLHL